jgi:segregation and condensation protein B
VTSDPALRGALEAILLVVDEPVAEADLARALEVPATDVAATLHDLAASYTEEGRGFALRRIAGGWRLVTREEFAPLVEQFVIAGRQSRLSQAALETLAVIAYLQPVARSRIAAIRGVGVDGVIRTLMSRGLVEESGTDPLTRASLLVTTSLFLEELGVDDLSALPGLAPMVPSPDEVLGESAG